MISFLEATSNAVYVVLVVFTVRTSYTTLLQIMVLYMIILPYVFLMNTSHNKDRLIEHGWTNVFKNVVARPKRHTVSRTDNSNQFNIILAQRLDKHKRKKTQHDSNAIFATTSSNNFPESKENVNSQNVYTISEAETSSRKRQSSQKPATLSININNWTKKDEGNDFRQKLISIMYEYIEDEKMYLIQFKQLLSFEESWKDRNNFSSQMECLENGMSLPNQVEKNAVKSCRCKGNHGCKSTWVSQGTRKGKCKYIDNDENSCFSNNLGFVGQIEERIEMRRKLLDNLRSCHNTNQVYDSLIEQLINLEEGLIL
jgi:hypothetical protein